VALAVVVDVCLLVTGVAALWVGAQRFVDSAARLARRAGISELVVGLSVVALGTSAPEAAVTVDAAVTGRPTIALANVVGSNVFNLGLILGGVALLAPVVGRRKLLRRDGTAAVLATLALLAVGADGTVSGVEGGLLLAGFLAYLAVLFGSADRSGTPTPAAGASSSRLPAPVWVVVGLALVVGGANLLVASAADLARLLGASEWLVGETVVAVGTSAPEVAAALAATREGLADIVAGNLVGSCIFNALGVLGVAAVLVELPVTGEASFALLWLTGLTVVAVGLLATGRRLSRPEGSALVVANLAKWLLDLL
jgi:cation:H+ antiporter